jgi:hypothetical protein
MNLQLSQMKHLNIKAVMIKKSSVLSNDNYMIMLLKTKEEGGCRVESNILLITQKNEVRQFKTIDAAFNVANKILLNNISKDICIYLEPDKDSVDVQVKNIPIRYSEDFVY